MRILIVSVFFPPLNSIASLRPYSWAKYWTEEGHDVTVLTTLKSEPSPHKGYKVIEVEEAPFLRSLKGNYHCTSTARKKNPLRKFYDWLRFTKGIFNATRMPDWTHLWIRPALAAIVEQPKWDLVVSTAGPYPVHLIAYRLKKLGQTDKWIADYRDPWSDNYIYPGLFPFNVIERILEERILRHADKITTVSEPFVCNYKKKYPHVPVHNVPNGFDSGDLEKLDPSPIFLQDGKIRIVHTGTLYLQKRDPTPLFEALALLRNSRLEVIFVGLHQANIQELIKQYAVEKWVRVLPCVPREDALRMQRDADFLLFLPWKDEVVDGVLTGKIYEYLFSGTPIIAVGAPVKEASQRLIEETGAGYLLPDAAAIDDFLRNVLKNELPILPPVEQASLAPFHRKTLAKMMLS